MMRERVPGRLLVAAAAMAFAGVAAGADRGPALYTEHCAVCHDAAGTGVPGFAPPLVGPVVARVKVPGGREYVAAVVVHGISGVFESGGQRQFGAMTPAPMLPDDDLAAVLNYVLGTLNAGALPGEFPPYTAADIAAARKVVRTPTELHQTKAALERAAR
jgi:mono/diheme cytochrome c family protein